MAVAGARFESYVKEAMREAAIPSLAELSRRSGIAVSAWHGWFRGEREPRRNSLVLAGEALSRTPEQLRATWDGDRLHKAAGRPQTPDDLVAALRDQTTAISALVASLDRFAVGLAAEAEAQAGMNEGLAALAGQVAAALQAREGTPG